MFVPGAAWILKATVTLFPGEEKERGKKVKGGAGVVNSTPVAHGVELLTPSEPGYAGF